MPTYKLHFYEVELKKIILYLLYCINISIHICHVYELTCVPTEGASEFYNLQFQVLFTILLF